MTDGFVGRMRKAVEPGRAVYHIDSNAEYAPHEVWVQPLVEGEPRLDERWEHIPSGRQVRITSAPFTSHWTDARLVPTDWGVYYVKELRPLPAHPWHRRADRSAAGKTQEPRMGGRRLWKRTTEVFQRRGLCERKGERRQGDEKSGE